MGRKEGRKEERKEGRKEERKEERKEGRKEGRKKGRKEGRKEGRKKGRKKGRKEGRKEGRKDNSERDQSTYNKNSVTSFIEMATSLFLTNLPGVWRLKICDGQNPGGKNSFPADVRQIYNKIIRREEHNM